ncbi:hypothetical protein JCGZ_20023 [Jatropha curcas]|uniref:Uncharacterized protein n=1 Tax=Jatropha curcas TaxID=180498 RepID=A0A067JXF0_JATCU|nr:hypothetical protein JCGZ_20023 [Jatropha curcas]
MPEVGEIAFKKVAPHRFLLPAINAVPGSFKARDMRRSTPHFQASLSLPSISTTGLDRGTTMDGSGEATVEAIFGQIRHTQSKLVTDSESP